MKKLYLTDKKMCLPETYWSASIRSFIKLYLFNKYLFFIRYFIELNGEVDRIIRWIIELFLFIQLTCEWLLNFIFFLTERGNGSAEQSVALPRRILCANQEFRHFKAISGISGISVQFRHFNAIALECWGIIFYLILW